MTLKVIEPKTWRWYLFIAFLIGLAMAASAWWAWQISGEVRDDLEQRVTLLTEDNKQLKDNLFSNEFQLTELGRSEQMAIANVDQTGLNLAALQEDKKQLEKELSFYRSIMAPELDKVGLNIQSFEIVEVEKGIFEYSLILTQVKKQDWYLKGNYSIELISENGGKESKLAMKQIVLNTSVKNRFSFRYFQTLTNRFQLPKGLQPQAILVSASTQDGKQRVTKRFPWIL